ncbi:ATP-dependent RNA helicase RhlE [Algoriphagus boseongensis]|uniref:ATP-dependent RNA helicase RhlE n=1 Tax=Algoriphagus boseongensis TaxID=1442587 RepID=A0A4R6T9G2_9BACT|nr:DEAD/DEAH box helicase [Algoriphagus boseongensis]TDQ18879.1 ATP-dependent RNA helicase RhlE [Algoriphagus boseongensis]
MNTSRKNNRPNFRGAPTSPGRHQPKRKAVSSLDPKLLVKKAKPTVSLTGPSLGKKFSELPLDSKLQLNIQKKGYTNLTPIQEQAVPVLLDGKDMLAISRTGSGKTAAFLIPLIMRLLKKPLASSVLIVAPTRELALQIGEEFKGLTLGMNFRWATFIGGTNLQSDLNHLSQKPQVLIGTPGRLLDLARQKVLHLKHVNTLVLDEFDRMLDMGFIQDVKRLVEMIGPREQTLLFSATLDPTQQKLISGLLNNPVEIHVDPGTSANEHIDQETIFVPEGEDKFMVLEKLLRNPELNKVILFAETKRLADRLAKKLVQGGITAGQIHGDKSQNFRNRVLGEFKSGTIRVLVATDVAARGIDVADVSHVINYQMPMTMDAYIHRIGRTGRAGKTGKAITFIN